MKKVFFIAIGVILLGIGIYRMQGNSSSTSATPSFTGSPTVSVSQKYTLSDVAKHADVKSCWMVISGNVYDVTQFIPQHPGGNDILKGCGIDATALFTGQDPAGRTHNMSAQSILGQYQIGMLTQ